MAIATGTGKHYLFLQGPHGPFFQHLGRLLRKTGATVWRVGFNAGDQAFWRHKPSYIAYKSPINAWADTLQTILDDKTITDIVLYGDTRPIHATAIAEANKRGLTVHVLEEGYLRPYWITYERGGSNGHSRLMDMSVGEIRQRLQDSNKDVPKVPSHWGDMREHVFYGALYHWFVMFTNRAYRNFAPHRDLSVSQEFKLYIKRLLLMPWHWIDRVLSTKRIKDGGYPYHLAMLQLEHDASFQAHSGFETMTDFLRVVIEGFAKGAPGHHHLVFKSHPLEDDRVPLARNIRQFAYENGIAERVHFLRGGKLARLLDYAQTAVTINSTAGQQVLWRGLPLKALGSAIYSKPEFVSQQSMPDFFSDPGHPDTAAYREFRLFLLETSQISGGYYSSRGRRQALRQLVDLMINPLDTYDALQSANAAPRQQLRVVG
ncbi:MAG: capsule biosynthesis protein [Paracoccaceae bacterium]